MRRSVQMGVFFGRSEYITRNQLRVIVQSLRYMNARTATDAHIRLNIQMYEGLFKYAQNPWKSSYLEGHIIECPIFVPKMNGRVSS